MNALDYTPPLQRGGRVGISVLLFFLIFVPAQADDRLTGLVKVPTYVICSPDQPRNFMLRNNDGSAYCYGSTTEEGWDSGWMGVWSDRKRIFTSIHVEDGLGSKLKFKDAVCKVSSWAVRWDWPGESERWLETSFFAGNQDTLLYTASMGLRLFQNELTPEFGTGESHAHLMSDPFSNVSRPAFSSDDAAIVIATMWSESSLRGLLAENDSLLYAGIPWFNEGWGRDTFISLPAFLVTGHADVAKKLIIRFANWIDRDPTSSTYGRIPNRARPGEEIAYNTTDGTPWWIRAIYEYGLYSGDYDLWRELFLDKRSESKPWAGSGRIALNGAMLKSDSLGFLMHADQETWMDAVGTTGCVTPRGNRAVEIQALHYTAFDCAIKMSMATDSHEFADDVRRWREMRTKIERNFLSSYLTPAHNGLWDHLNVDGSSDSLFRPNQLFAVTVPVTPLVPPEIRHKLLARVINKLVQRHGVMSLSPDEELFHPFHMHERYPKDDAYHNGIVWVWLSGPAKTALRMEGRADLALELANYEANYLLNYGMVGSLPELFDAMPRKGEKMPRQSGCTSQTWSLAEFLRTMYQDILGIRPVQVRNKVEPFWLFDPRIPEAWGETRVRVTLSGVPLMIHMQNFGDSINVTLDPLDSLRVPLPVKIFDEQNGVTGLINEQKPVHFVYVKDQQTIFADGYPTSKVKLTGWPYHDGAKDLALSKPLKMRDWQSLRPPEWDVLTAKQVLAKNDKADVIANEADPVGDDNGDGDYTYPLDEHFAPGILDIARFTVREDKKNYYFELEFASLVQPGWHPEYGFQLTFAAICLNDGKGVRHEVGANSSFVLNKESAASRIIYVGGGLRVEDDRSRTLATFTPTSPIDAFGDTTSRTIAFALPKKLFPKHEVKVRKVVYGSHPPSLDDPWTWTVLVGAQDDHGGAGMGEFRAVTATAEQWSGGGNERGAPNVYDRLQAMRTPSLHIRY